MPRLGHKKSRNGCRQCKARHVKCDERTPCSNCARHGVLCSLVDPNAQPSVKREPSVASNASRVSGAISERPRKSASQPDSLQIDYVLNPSPAPAAGTSSNGSPYTSPDTLPFLTKFVNHDGSVQPSSWARDLELMHHWTTEAHHILSERDDVKHMWRIVAPKQAVHHLSLMHALLCFSALHRAYLYPDQRRSFHALAIYHQDLALRNLRETLLDLSPDNAGALFATSTLTTISVIASTGLDAKDASAKPRPALDDVMEIFALQHGVSSIVSNGATYVAQGPFAPILADAQMDIPHQPILQQVLARIPLLINFIESQPQVQALPAPARQALLENLVSFSSVLEQAVAPFADSRELRFLFSWPASITQSFSNMLRLKEAPALVILAYYAVVLRAAEPKYWFMDGWAERVVRAVAEAVEPNWKPILQWPWDFILGAQDSHAQPQEQSATG